MIRAQIKQRTNKMDAKDQNWFSYSGQKIRNAIFLVLIKSQDAISECLENFIICGFCGIISIFRWERHWTQSQTMVASAICLWIILLEDWVYLKHMKMRIYIYWNKLKVAEYKRIYNFFCKFDIWSKSKVGFELVVQIWLTSPCWWIQVNQGRQDIDPRGINTGLNPFHEWVLGSSK